MDIPNVLYIVGSTSKFDSMTSLAQKSFVIFALPGATITFEYYTIENVQLNPRNDHMKT
jgi:hypothetical protein